MNISDKLQRINGQWKEIEKNLNFLEKECPPIKAHINSLGKGINAVALNFQHAHENIEKRQFLIDFQCNRNVFTGPTHEEYHAVTAQLDVEFDTYLASIKTALNRLPSLIYKFMGHSDRRGIKSKSFGVFINSISTKKFESDYMKNIQNAFLKSGKEIDRTINEYRDKNIEHIQNPSNEYGLVSDKKGVRRHHQKTVFSAMPRNEDFENFKKRIESLPKEKRSDVIRARRPDGEHIYYVHIENDQKLEGQIRKGGLLGYASDGGSGHFEKYGSHMHVFTSPNLPIEEINNRDGNFSPSAFESLISITKFLALIIKQIIEAVRKNNNFLNIKHENQLANKKIRRIA